MRSASDTSHPRRLLVVGAGAIGAALGALLSENGLPVTLIARGPHGRALDSAGVHLRLPEPAGRAGTSRNIRVAVAERLEILDPGPEDLVLLTTMAHQTDDALAGLPASVPVVSLQNGVHAPDRVRQRGHPTVAGMVFVMAERRGPGVIALSGAPGPGTVLLGPWGPDAPERAGMWLAAQLDAVGIRAEWEPDIAPWIRAKLLTNLGGIVVALCDEPPVELIEAAQAEALAVWAAAAEPTETVEALLGRVGPLQSLCVDGAPRIGGSTRAALARGDVLETGALHGPIVEAGRRFGVPTPVNDALIRLAEDAMLRRLAPGALSAAELRRSALGRP